MQQFIFDNVCVSFLRVCENAQRYFDPINNYGKTIELFESLCQYGLLNNVFTLIAISTSPQNLHAPSNSVSTKNLVTLLKVLSACFKASAALTLTAIIEHSVFHTIKSLLERHRQESVNVDKDASFVLETLMLLDSIIPEKITKE